MISVNVQGVEKVIKDLDNLVSDKKIWIFLERLGRMGVETCQRAYNMGAKDGNYASVTYEVYPNGCVIRADGNDVGFLEFGTGVGVDTFNDFISQVPYDVSSGSWSKDHHKQFINKGYWYHKKVWHHKKVKYFATPPTRGMQKAKYKILDEIERVAREVFKND